MGDAGCAPRPGCEMRDAGCVRQSNPLLRDSGTLSLVPRRYLSAMRRLQKLDTWRGAQELARAAYLLTTTPTVSKHFALVDQIRRAAISIPANIAEGYALGTTAQFVRCLKIALGSSTELLSHLTLLKSLGLMPETELQPCIDLCERVVAMTIGLIRRLMSR
ncbi:MAG: four helix bundle protein [Gemmatimonadetes bacterium]|nr:MAG: four helix bundle protein [Gemmatimonadota bacterium]